MPSILLAFDASPASVRAMELLAGLAAARVAPTVEVVSAQAAPVTLWPGAQAQFEVLRQSLLDIASESAGTAVRRLTDAGIAASSLARIGSPADLVLQLARERKVAAIAMGTRGHGPLNGFHLGSVALRVAHGGAVPVILVKPGDRLPLATGRQLRVLLATDGSPAPVRAAEWLASRRDWFGELTVDVAWVQPPLTVLEAILPPHDDVIRQWSAREGEVAAEATRVVLARAGITHAFHRLVGDPVSELSALAGRSGAELVALGSRGLGAAHHALVGSVALKVCAVGAVPTVLVP